MVGSMLDFLVTGGRCGLRVPRSRLTITYLLTTKSSVGDRGAIDLVETGMCMPLSGEQRWRSLALRISAILLLSGVPVRASAGEAELESLLNQSLRRATEEIRIEVDQCTIEMQMTFVDDLCIGGQIQSINVIIDLEEISDIEVLTDENSGIGLSFEDDLNDMLMSLNDAHIFSRAATEQALSDNGFNYRRWARLCDGEERSAIIGGAEVFLVQPGTAATVSEALRSHQRAYCLADE